jgi:hypothetical protein
MFSLWSQPSQDDCEKLIEKIGSPSRLVRLYAIRATGDCRGSENSGRGLGDALLSVLLGDDGEIQSEALEALGGFLHPSQLPVLVQYGSNLKPHSSPYLRLDSEPLQSLPQSYLETHTLIYSYINRILRSNADIDWSPRTSLRLAVYLKEGMFHDGFAVDPSLLREMQCLNMESLAMMGESIDYVLRFLEASEDLPGCGLYALSLYDREDLSSRSLSRADRLSREALQRKGFTARMARKWFAGDRSLLSLSIILQGIQRERPFAEPEAHSLAQALPGVQGRVTERAGLYRHPWTSGPLLRVLSDGTAVTVLRKSRSYDNSAEGADYSYLVTTEDGITGWVAASQLRLESKKN